MILSDRDIKKAIAEGRIRITPAPDYAQQLSACMIDLHLGKKFRTFNRSRHPYIDLKAPLDADEITKEITIPDGEAFIMQPGDFALAITEEKLELPDDLVGRIEGRSSLGRIGIIVHGTASVFHPGWTGKVTMELGNLGTMPVALYPGMRICAFTFEQLSSMAEKPYRGKYTGATGPDASKLSRKS